jgi:hypothetical protein
VGTAASPNNVDCKAAGPCFSFTSFHRQSPAPANPQWPGLWLPPVCSPGPCLARGAHQCLCLWSPRATLMCICAWQLARRGSAYGRDVHQPLLSRRWRACACARSLLSSTHYLSTAPRERLNAPASSAMDALDRSMPLVARLQYALALACAHAHTRHIYLATLASLEAIGSVEWEHFLDLAGKQACSLSLTHTHTHALCLPAKCVRNHRDGRIGQG